MIVEHEFCEFHNRFFLQHTKKKSKSVGHIWQKQQTQSFKESFSATKLRMSRIQQNRMSVKEFSARENLVLYFEFSIFFLIKSVTHKISIFLSASHKKEYITITLICEIVCNELNSNVILRNQFTHKNKADKTIKFAR
jgi:ABC-type uncharacterized transport system ATPase subunit